MTVRIWVTDVSARQGVRVATLAGVDALVAWVHEAAALPSRFYDQYLPETGGGLRFALGQGAVGGVFEAHDDGQCFWLREGDPAAPAIDVPGDGDVFPVSGDEQIPLERLVEVLSRYALDGQRPPGRWIGLDGRPPQTSGPWRGGRPQARGMHARALVAWLESHPRRDTPDAACLELLHRTRDPELQAWIWACAHHHGVEQLRLADLWAAAPRAEGEDIALGTLGSGEPVVAGPRGVWLVAPDAPSYRRFETFVADLVAQAREDGQETSFDPWLRGPGSAP